MSDLHSHSAGDSIVEKSSNLLEYLSAVAREIGPETVRDVHSHEFRLFPGQVPQHPAITIQLTDEASEYLRVQRVKAPDPISVPPALRVLVGAAELESPDPEPQLTDAALAEQLRREIPDTADDHEGHSERDEERSARRRELREEFDNWKQSSWNPWAVRTRLDLRAREIYNNLHHLHHDMATESATHELVWGQLLLSHRGEEATVVAPLIATRATVEVDEQDASIRVIADGTSEMELDAVEGIGLPGVETLNTLRGELRHSGIDLTTSESRLTLRKKIVAPMGLDATLSDSTDPVKPGPDPQLNDGWVLFRRRRPLRQERFYDELAHKIQAENFVPEALASLVVDNDQVDRALVEQGQPTGVDDGTADRLLMPLPTNEEQERIARQLARARGVTVQGPPGTGKSHTIVNLISHLVAQGKRVLVTAEKDQALSVLRDKIPEPLRDLSVSVLGSTPAALEQLRSAVQATQDSLSSLEIERELPRIAERGHEIDDLREELRRIDASLVEALRSEQREFPLPSGPAKAPQVAQWLAQNREFDVIPDGLDADTPFPLDHQEFAELVSPLRSISPEDAAAAVQDLPTESWVPVGDEIAATLEKLDGLRQRVTTLEDSGLRVESLDSWSLERLRAEASTLRDRAREIDAITGDWEDVLAASVREGSTAVAWVQQHNPHLLERISAAQDTASKLVGVTASVPEGDPTLQLDLLKQWSERLQAGKKISIFASRELREISAQVTINGHSPTTAGQVDLAGWQVRLRALLVEIHRLMTQTYTPADIPVPAFDDSALFQASSRAQRVSEVLAFWSGTYPELRKFLSQLVPLPESSLNPAILRHTAGLLDDAAARIEERSVSAELDRLTTRLSERARSRDASPLWKALRSAVDTGNPREWNRCTAEAQRLRGVRTLVLRYTDLIKKIKDSGAPEWASAVRHSRADPQITPDYTGATQSWQLAQARTWLKALHTSTDVSAMMDRSQQVTHALTDAVIDVASRSARVELKRNLRDQQRRALDTWLTAVKKIGKGTGKNAPRFRAVAREALPAAMGAMPVWIMPVHRVLENFDPQVSDLFDVVIVDESSQCDLLTLGVLALGKKTVVVGDDKQTSPQRVGVRVDKISELQDQHLRGIPGAKLLTLDESLYSLAGRAYPSTIALREHFRCVPEIIEFSNRYYSGGIQPLREVTVPQIGEPVQVVHVPDAVSEKRGAQRVNLDEARALADALAKCVADPEYQGLTFGVVTMMSGPQAQHLQDMIRERIGEQEFESRQLRVGTPPHFQGDERNVVFISMVAHDNSFAFTSGHNAQWMNVAASRARDQLWIFHSMDPKTLHHEDQRAALIEYGRSRSREQRSADLYDATDSQFERDVLRQLLQRGFDVEPQYRVGRYRLDFVVQVAPGERLAIECDGDSFHGPDAWDADVRRQRVLERLGWTFWRVRASKYYYDPEAAMKPLWDRLAEMRRRAEERAEQREMKKQREEQKALSEVRAVETS